jgi:hypothetical protein
VSLLKTASTWFSCVALIATTRVVLQGHRSEFNLDNLDEPIWTYLLASP